jgi:8-oxo-dGTP pyrophosphatase MutT (NUDIX family)
VEKSAGGIVVRRVGGVPHVLVIRDPYQNWGLPKGHVENGEAPGDAALREVAEETGLGDLALGPEIGRIDWYFRAGGNLIHKFCAFYLMTSEVGDAVPEAGEGITECVWIPLDAAEERVTYENARGVVRKAREIVENGMGPGAS